MQRRHLLQLLAATPFLGPVHASEDEFVIAANQTTIESAALLIQKIPGVRVIPVASGRVASAQLVAGTVDASTGNETQATVNSFARPELRIVLTLAECRYRMVARRSAGILSTADLRGKRVAFTLGTSSQYFLFDVLRSAGLQMNDITPVILEPTDMPAALVDGRIDAMAMWEPQPEVALRRLGDDGILLRNPGQDAYFERFGINTTAAVLANPQRRAALVKAARSIADMSREISANPQAYIPALAKAIDTSPDVIEKVWPQFRFPARLEAQGLVTTLSRMEPWAAAYAKQQARPMSTLIAMVDDSISKEAAL